MALFANLEVDMGDKGKISYLEGVMKHPGQKLIHFQDWMYLVLDWGRRTGKTIGAAAEAVWELSKDNRKIWIVAPTYELTDRVFEIVYKWVVLDNCFGGKAVIRSAKSKDARYIQMRWGSIIRGKSADAPASLLGDQTDLIIMDVMMPGEIDGFDAVSIIKGNSKTKHCKVIMLTGKGQDIDKEKGVSVGADEYFVKPFSPLALIRKVEEVLG